MSFRTYVNFDLLLDKHEDGFQARVVNSPAGQASHVFALPFSDLELENFILKMGQKRGNVRSLHYTSSDKLTIEGFGGTLYSSIFAGDINECFRESQGIARSKMQGLRIRLRFSSALKLIDIPWEFLFDPSKKRFIGLSNNTPIVRNLDLTSPMRSSKVEGALKVLVMISSPKDQYQLDVEREWKRIDKATSELQKSGQIHIDRLEEPSLGALQSALRKKNYHIFHYIGHGGYDEATKGGVLILEDSDKKSHYVSGHYLGTILYDADTLKLAILNACNGGRTSTSDPFAGVGQSLLQQDIPAVVAMQFEITDDAAITFAHEFYAAMVDGFPIDAAVSEARKTIYAQANEIEWATPVLYMSSEDGNIFTIDKQKRKAEMLAAKEEAERIKEKEQQRGDNEKLQAELKVQKEAEEKLEKEQRIIQKQKEERQRRDKEKLETELKAQKEAEKKLEKEQRIIQKQKEEQQRRDSEKLKAERKARKEAEESIVKERVIKAEKTKQQANGQLQPKAESPSHPGNSKGKSWLVMSGLMLLAAIVGYIISIKTTDTQDTTLAVKELKKEQQTRKPAIEKKPEKEVKPKLDTTGKVSVEKKSTPPKRQELFMGASTLLLTGSCSGCHGQNGVSVGPGIPTIAGMSSEYFVEMMEAYKSDDTPSTVMGRIAKGYTSEELVQMGDYFSTQKFVPASGQKSDTRLADEGAKLHDKYCEKCHSEGGTSAEDDSGILKGQWKSYLAAQLMDFVSGERKAPKKMTKKMKSLYDKHGDKGIKALLEFYAK